MVEEPIEGSWHDLRDLGARVRLHAADGGDLGVAHTPAPVELGDVVTSADGRVWVVTNLIDFGASRGALDALVEVRPGDC